MGRFVRVGIVDSIFAPGDDLWATLGVDRTENYLDTEAPDTTGHGGDVLELSGYFAPESTYDLYRVVAGNQRARRGDLVAAIGDASRNGVDVLNLSIGIYHRNEPDNDCGGHCRVADETRLAVQDGMTVVAAAGNRQESDPGAVHCPALLDETIGVGGFVARCTNDPVETVDSGQYWIRDEGPFCGQRGCGPGHSCEGYRYEYPWRGNPSFHNAVPDVLAPVHHPAGTGEEPILQTGTSFGAPVVSGLIAAMLGDLFEHGIEPTPRDIHQAVCAGGSAIDEGATPKFDAGGAWDLLVET